jgi:hypothetical protein
VPDAGEYLFSRVGFSKDQTPVLSFQKDESFIDLMPLGQTLALHFNTTQRFCIGWSNITTGERFVCPEHHVIEGKYEQCATCQQRTGFNPAFYHAARVSKQQEARNLESHIVYLAYFGEGTLKVGISHAARGNSRLLEQGARYALMLDTFPSAHIARKYEAQIAKLSGIAETIQLRKKIALLPAHVTKELASQELIAARSRIEQELGVTFAKNDIQSLDKYYFPRTHLDLPNAYNCSNQDRISGMAIGMLGSLLFCQYADTLVFLPLKKYIGFRVYISHDEIPLVLPAHQTSLF